MGRHRRGHREAAGDAREQENLVFIINTFFIIRLSNRRRMVQSRSNMSREERCVTLIPIVPATDRFVDNAPGRVPVVRGHAHARRPARHRIPRTSTERAIPTWTSRRPTCTPRRSSSAIRRCCADAVRQSALDQPDLVAGHGIRRAGASRGAPVLQRLARRMDGRLHGQREPRAEAHR